MVFFPIGCTNYCFIKKQIFLHQHLFNKQHVSLCKDHCWEQKQCDRSLIPFLTIPARRALESKGARDGKIQVSKNPFPKIYFFQISSFFFFYFQAILLPPTYFSPLFFSTSQIFTEWNLGTLRRNFQLQALRPFTFKMAVGVARVLDPHFIS